MKKEFKPGEFIEIVSDNTSHGFAKGSRHVVLERCDQESFRVAYENNGFCYKIIIDDKDVILADDTDSINAEIQAAIDPNRYASLTEFNRVSSYEGGGFKNITSLPNGFTHSYE